ncbi:MAG: ABC transporter permease [Halanaerobiaceae bacterium]
MKIFEYIKLALLEIWHNKVRTFLTLLGIIIGITAIVTIIFVIQGAEDFLMHEMEKKYPLDVVVASPKHDSRTQAPLVEPEISDLDDLKQKEDFAALNLDISHQEQIFSQEQKLEAHVMGTGVDLLRIKELEMKRGNFFNQVNLRNHHRVAVLEKELAEELFKQRDPVGERIYFNGNSFEIIGIIAEGEESLLGGFGEDRILIPSTVYQRLDNGSQNVNLQARFVEEMTQGQAIDRFHQLLDDYFGLTSEGESKFEVRKGIYYDEIIDIIPLALMILLGGVASLTLLVAGIGVMNIMLVIVTERTREVGLRKALGATRGSIMLQFLIESVILCLVGGVLGVVGGYVASEAAYGFVDNMIDLGIRPTVPYWSVIVAFIFTSGVGLFFGIYPAYKASKLDPIVALEQE